MSIPFHPFSPERPFKTNALNLHVKLDYCMQKISELECRIRQLESEKVINSFEPLQRQHLVKVTTQIKNNSTLVE